MPEIKNLQALAPTCPYCHSNSEITDGSEIYPHRTDLRQKKFYICRMCNAYVGCHTNGLPLGRLANARLRKAKQKAHAAFDPIWKSGKKSRKEAYQWLGEKLGINKENCHIGMFDEENCLRVVELCKNNQLPKGA